MIPKQNFSQNQLSILEAKYLQKDENGKVSEDPETLFKRVAKAVSMVEEHKDRLKLQELFYQMMSNLEFLPGGRTLANAGTSNGQLANCFVLPFNDNIEEIFDSVRDSAILKKNGGGVGFSFSKIRPRNDQIIGTSGKACGPVALMKVLDACSEIFLQDGKRRSGNMIVLSVSHPDIFDFITCKQNDQSLNQINFSLWIPDGFIKKVLANKKWDLVNPRSGRKVSKVTAHSIFELATTMAWKNGDPGILFSDRINKDNPTPLSGPIEAVNLCGEQPLLPYEACNLGSINLVKFLTNIAKDKYEIDWEKLEKITRLATRFLDDVIDVCKYPLTKVDRVVKENRKIGLGVMGWADFLIKLQIPYGSLESLKLAEKVMKFITDSSHNESEKLGKKRGSFPSFRQSIWQKKVKAMRNSTTTTIAPTGSISMVAGVSSGIEPIFALSYYKEVMGGLRLKEINPDLIYDLDKLKLKDQKIKEIINQKGTLENISDLPKHLKEVYKTAHELTYQEHIKMQAAFQKYTDNAVSKTINFPHNATVEDIQKAFILAWKLKCKGLTIYRDGSRSTQVLHVGDGEKKQTNQVCPKCGGNIVFSEGCSKCENCGWGACSI